MAKDKSFEELSDIEYAAFCLTRLLSILNTDIDPGPVYEVMLQALMEGLYEDEIDALAQRLIAVSTADVISRELH